MKLNEFKIGAKFWMSGQQYVCADVGTRSVVAVRYDVGELIEFTCVGYNSKGKREEETRSVKRTIKQFYSLFPDGLHDLVIYPYDFPACQKTKTKFQQSLIKERRKANAKN
jgi:hypothetical protein